MKLPKFLQGGLENQWATAYLLSALSVLLALITTSMSSGVLDTKFWSRTFLLLIAISAGLHWAYYFESNEKQCPNNEERPWWRFFGIIIAPTFALMGEAAVLTFLTYTDLASELDDSGELGHLLYIVFTGIGGFLMGGVGLWTTTQILSACPVKI